MTEYGARLFSLETKFDHVQNPNFPTETSGDVMQLAKRFLNLNVNPEFIITSYVALKNVDVEGSNIFGDSSPWIKNICQVFLCSVNPLCKGFTSDGQLKNAITTTQLEGSVVYMKNKG